MLGAVCGRVGANVGSALLGAHAGLMQTGGQALALSVPACGAPGLGKQGRFSSSSPFSNQPSSGLRQTDSAAPNRSSEAPSLAFAERLASGNCASTSTSGATLSGSPSFFYSPPFALDNGSSAGLSPLASSSTTLRNTPIRGGIRMRGRLRPRPLSSMSGSLRGGADGLGSWLTPNRLGSNAWPGAWILFGLSSGLAAAEVSQEDSGDVDDDWCSGSGRGVRGAATCHAKGVLTNYRKLGVRGDGRCLFRAVAHGVNMQEKKGAQDSEQDEAQADRLRNMAMDELEQRRKESEWFIEGDFDRYVKRMRHPGVWGGEPELLMLSHALKKAITVYIPDPSGAGILSIAEYGQEYGKDAVAVLYNGSTHYDALILGPEIAEHITASKL